jgi:hypothetical protein
MEINPYASPCEQTESNEVPLGEYYVDGSYLVVTDGAVLPMRCVVTGELVSAEDRETKQFEWAPSFRLVLHRRKCIVSFYVSHRVRRKEFWKRVLWGLVTPLLGWFWVGPYALWLLLILPFHIWRTDVIPMKVHREANGRFWISGCGQAFLASCDRRIDGNASVDNTI